VNRTAPEIAPLAAAGETLDPESWDETRALAHRMLDDMIDYVATIRERPVWQPIPDVVRAQFRESLPREPADLGEIYRTFSEFILPYATGNVHPGFLGWVHGGGSVVGMLAEMLAAGLNANLGGRDHVRSRSSGRSSNGPARCSAFRPAPAASSLPARRWPICWRFWWRARPRLELRRASTASRVRAGC
jgi:hypothetical protein